MWKQYRKWKHAVAPILLAIAYVCLKTFAEGTAPWYVGLVLACVVGGVYVIEEIVWNLKGKGRPCPACGHEVRMKTFRVHNTCPNCGEQL
jgi:hypothetical protein